jgi:hypothetical protein
MVGDGLRLTDHNNNVLNLHIHGFWANIFPGYADLQATYLTVDELKREPECLEDVFFNFNIVELYVSTPERYF